MEKTESVEPGGPIRMIDAGEIHEDVFRDVLSEVIDLLEDHDIEYGIVGGLAVATLGRPRWTHDIDVFLRPDDAIRVMRLLENEGYQTEETNPTWLLKATRDEVTVDLLFRSEGNIYFDEQVASRTRRETFFDKPLRVVSPEDLILIKAAAHMEEGGYHWFDALAVLTRQDIDWDYLRQRAGHHVRRILSLLVYADSLDIAVPSRVIRELAADCYQLPSLEVAPDTEHAAPIPSVSGRRPERHSEESGASVRVAAVGDLHYGPEGQAPDRHALAAEVEGADLLLLAGDLTQRGRVEEVDALIDDLADLDMPILAVLGNHDVESGDEDKVRARLEDVGVTVLAGESTVLDVGGVRVGVAGTIGFGGGFHGARCAEFGEPEMKAFMARANATAAELEHALDGLDADLRIALTHYSPVRETLVGEPPELFPFLGTDLLATAIDRGAADVVFHGHAHHGSPSGRTPGGVPVHNVARPVLRRPAAQFTVTAAR